MEYGGALTSVGILAEFKNLEPTLGEKSTTLWIGNLAETVSDTVIDNTLRCCGPLKSWRRVFDHDDKPKNFGFCEYESGESTLRCIRLLDNFPVFGKNLVIKFDERTRKYLDSCQLAIEGLTFGTNYLDADLIALEQVDYVLKFGKDLIEKEYGIQVTQDQKPVKKKFKEAKAVDDQRDFRLELAKWEDRERRMQKLRQSEKEREYYRVKDRERYIADLLEYYENFDRHEEYLTEKYTEKRRIELQKEQEADEKLLQKWKELSPARAHQ